MANLLSLEKNIRENILLGALLKKLKPVISRNKIKLRKLDSV